jgi:CRP/FNR family cyclic AMP-dependent transcriptional regulator
MSDQLGKLPMDQSEAETRILRYGWLADQLPAVQSDVLRHANLVFHPAGEFAFHAGDPQGGMYGVVSGGVGIHLPLDNGETSLGHIARSGVWFGYGPLIRDRPRSLSFSFTEPSWLLHVHLVKLTALAARSPLHQKAILSVGEYGMDIAIRVTSTLLARNAEHRIAATLLRILPPPEEVWEGQAFELLLTQSQLGEMANADRKVVNRTLRRMTAKGWLKVSYGRVEIIDRAALESFVRST